MTEPNPNQTPQLPTNPPDSGTIDITNVVEALRASFVTWATVTVFGIAVATPGLQWLALPFISTLFRTLLGWIFTLLSKTAVMEMFFLNTVVRKASQAQDYINAVNAKNSLPPTASQEEYENAEKAEMAAFYNFVRVTN